MDTQYHLGFRSQSSAWPTNPVDHYITTLSRSPKGTIIADLGCGDATLARELLPKGLVVLSYDLVSRNPDGLVVEADICARIPLPGGEEGPAEGAEDGSGATGQVVDVCVCSLSLMNTNWVGCVRECWRILKDG
jgi:ribosomal RNA-processing protein 8